LERVREEKKDMGADNVSWRGRSRLLAERPGKKKHNAGLLLSVGGKITPEYDTTSGFKKGKGGSHFSRSFEEKDRMGERCSTSELTRGEAKRSGHLTKLCRIEERAV